MLTVDEIQFLLKLLNRRTVVEPNKDFPFTVVKDGFGYSDDPIVGPLQAKLSIMAQVAAKAGR